MEHYSTLVYGKISQNRAIVIEICTINRYMENIEIILGGITRTPSDKSSQNGQLEDAINLENVDGEMRPVYPPKKIGNKSGLIYVHRRDGDDYMFYQIIGGITIQKADGTVVHENIAIPFTITGIESVGNTVIIAAGNLYYLLYKGGTYKLLGSEIPYPIANFSMESVPILLPNGYGEFDGSIGAIIQSLYEVDNPKATYTLPREEVRDMLTKKLNDIVTTGLIKHIAKTMDDGMFSFPFFVRYALRMYDGTLIKHSPPFLMVPSHFARNNLYGKYEYARISYELEPPTDNGTRMVSRVSIEIAQAKLKCDTYINNDLSDWSDIIQSVDIFVSKPQYVVDVNGKVGLKQLPVLPVASITNNSMLKMPAIEQQAILSALASEGNFYLLHSLPLSTFAIASRVFPIETSPSKLKTIVNQELMTDDYRYHDNISADSVNAYNARISLSGVKSTVFRGFYSATQTVISGKVLYNGAGHNANPFVYHPDKRAETSNNAQMNVALKPHTSLNGSYFINPFLTATYNGAAPATYSDVLIDDLTDKLYTSEINNPFIFKPSGIITLQGTVMGTATTTEPLSQGQFGQFPLYVFTSKGVWALEISNTGSFSSKQIITREVCINANSITQLKREIAFMTEKGLCIIAGKDTEVITSVLEDSRYLYPIIELNNSAIATLTAKAGVGALTDLVNNGANDPSFQTYLQNAIPAFDPVNDRIYLYNPGIEYTYIFNMNSRTWTKQQIQIVKTVSNYPSLYFQLADGNLYEPSLQVWDNTQSPVELDTNKEVGVFFLTRAVKLEDLKFLIQQLRMKGIVTYKHPQASGTANVIALYGSADGINYQHVGSTEKHVLRMRGSAYKYYKIAYAGKLKPVDHIGNITIEPVLKQKNKLR